MLELHVMQSRNDQPEVALINYSEYSIGTDSVFNSLVEYPASNVPAQNAFLLLDGENMLLLDNSDFLLLGS
jgi:hypothetical protein